MIDRDVHGIPRCLLDSSACPASTGKVVYNQLSVSHFCKTSFPPPSTSRRHPPRLLPSNCKNHQIRSSSIFYHALSCSSYRPLLNMQNIFRIPLCISHHRRHPIPWQTHRPRHSRPAPLSIPAPPFWRCCHLRLFFIPSTSPAVSYIGLFPPVFYGDKRRNRPRLPVSAAPSAGASDIRRLR